MSYGNISSNAGKSYCWTFDIEIKLEFIFFTFKNTSTIKNIMFYLCFLLGLTSLTCKFLCNFGDIYFKKA